MGPEPRSTARNRRWRRAIPLLLLLLGGSAGFLLGRIGPGGSPGRGAPEDMMRRVATDLGLNEEQTAALHVIVETNHSEASEFREASIARYRELRRRFREQIREILTPEQRERFDSMIREADHRHRGRRSGPRREERP